MSSVEIIGNKTATVGTSAADILGKNHSRGTLNIQNNGAADIYINFGANATVANGWVVKASGGTERWKAEDCPIDRISAISTGAGNAIIILES